MINGLERDANNEDCQKLLYRKVANHKWTEGVLGTVANIQVRENHKQSSLLYVCDFLKHY